MWVQSVGQKEPLEKGMATYSSILAWKIPWIEEPDKQQPIRLQRIRHDLAHTCSYMLHAGQEVTVRNGHGPTDWFQIGKGVHQGCI